MGFCGADPAQTPFQFTIGEDNHNSDCFVDAVWALVATGWLRRYDILVVDNSQVHCGGDATDLEDALWNNPSPFDGLPLRILLVYLPTRSPELNPIELLWHTLVERLKCLRMQGMWFGRAAAFLQAQNVMNGFDHGLVASTFKHCHYTNGI
jgi:hypothetical protein